MAYIYGTDASETITGYDYEADFIYGFLGDDVLIAGAGNYSVTGMAEQEALFGEGQAFWGWECGDDTLIGGSDVYRTDLLADGWDVFYSTGGDDILIAGSGGDSNFMFGDGGNSYASQGGNDLLYGGNGAATNLMFGDTWIMWGECTGGDDLIVAGDGGVNFMWADAAQVQGTGNRGGDDRLVSGTGIDHMWGDAEPQLVHGEYQTGADTFAFHAGNGNDIIYDFEQGKDLIEVHMPATLRLPLPDIALGKLPISKMSEKALAKVFDDYDFADMIIDVVDGNSVVHFDAGNSVTIIGVTGLAASDFLFI